MSSFFEGVVISKRIGSFETQLSSSYSALTIVEEALSELWSVVYIAGRHSTAQGEEVMRGVAGQYSTKNGRVLLVLYNNQIGDRRSEVFEGGFKIAQFGKENELFVPLDNDGLPLLDVPSIPFSDLEPTGEYETIENAIQLGLAQLGARSEWVALKRVADSA